MIDALSAQTSLTAGLAGRDKTLSETLDTIARGMKAGDTKAQDAARQSAQEFESMVLGTFFESMFAGIKTDGPFGGGQGETMYRSLLTQEYSKAITERGGIGLADHVMAQLQRLQEGS